MTPKLAPALTTGMNALYSHLAGFIGDETASGSRSMPSVATQRSAFGMAKCHAALAVMNTRTRWRFDPALKPNNSTAKMATVGATLFLSGCEMNAQDQLALELMGVLFLSTFVISLPAILKPFTPVERMKRELRKQELELEILNKRLQISKVDAEIKMIEDQKWQNQKKIPE